MFYSLHSLMGLYFVDYSIRKLGLLSELFMHHIKGIKIQGWIKVLCELMHFWCFVALSYTPATVYFHAFCLHRLNRNSVCEYICVHGCDDLEMRCVQLNFWRFAILATENTSAPLSEYNRCEQSDVHCDLDAYPMHEHPRLLHTWTHNNTNPNFTSAINRILNKTILLYA